MADSWSSDDDDRITGLRSAKKTRRCRRKKTVSPHCVVRCKVPGQITVPGRIIYFNTIEMLDELSSVYNTHGADKLLYYIQQRFERSRRDTAAVTHSRGEDREVCRMVWSYYIAYSLTENKQCIRKIKDLVRNMHNLNLNYADTVISQTQNFLYNFAMNDNNYSKAHKHLQASLLVLQNVTPGTYTANVYEHLAVMYDCLAYLMPHRKTPHLHSALHLYSVAREHFRCEGERTGDWEVVNTGITTITLCMININLKMPNGIGYNTSQYGALYHSSLVEDSGRRCTVTDIDVSAAEYMWDHINKPIDLNTMDINYDLACVIYIYLRKSQIKKQGREYTLALEACFTAMRWYKDLYDRIKPAITTQIGCVLIELFYEIQGKLETSAADAGADMLHQDEEVVHRDECYIDHMVLCYTRTEEEDDHAVVYSGLSDTSFNVSSKSDENIGNKQVEKSKPAFAQTSSSSLKKDAFITEESCFPQSIFDSDERSVTEPPYSNEGISTEDEVPEPEIYINWSTVEMFLQYMGYDIDSSDEDAVCTDSDNDAVACEGYKVSISDGEDTPATEQIHINQLLLDTFTDKIQNHNDESLDIPEDINAEHNPITSDSQSHYSVMNPDDEFQKETGDNGSESPAQSATRRITKFSSKTCTVSLFDDDSDKSETTHVLTSEQSATDSEKEDTSDSFQMKDEEMKMSLVNREGKIDTISLDSESEYHTGQKNHNGQGTDSDTSGQERNASDNDQVVNEDGSDVKPAVVLKFKYDPSVDDVTDSSGLDESSPNDDSQDTEVMDGY